MQGLHHWLPTPHQLILETNTTTLTSSLLFAISVQYVEVIIYIRQIFSICKD